ncbi:SpoOM family protein [Brevibacillus fluminis]|uniref:SpoOM family protein n=1 Tax=Brevibacillus fluminis TaxID=511487 RepID=A0A3M8DYF6_9BACL|nr:sporulation protein [Brevibacillus fluminis]RNB92261.1 SpoOM family protein [Brevibacillus fluminis]
MFKKIMAKFGIGAATVDLRLDREAFRLGETITGMIHIEGGAVEQRISQLSVALVLKANVKGSVVTRVVATIPVLQHFIVQPKPSTQEVPFYYELPKELAISTPAIGYHLQTVLDVELAVDPTDLDRVTVLPTADVQQVFYAFEQLELRQKASSGKLTRFGQEFSFFPGRPFSVPLQEIGVTFSEAVEGLRLLLELDVAQAGLFRREREHRAEIVIPRELLQEDTLPQLIDFLSDKLEQYLQNPESIPYVSYPRYGDRYDHSPSSFGIGEMMGGMAVGLLGGMLLNELIDDASEIAGDSLFGDDTGIFSDDDTSADDGGSDGGDFGGSDDFGGFDE